MLNIQAELEEEWKVKLEILEQLKKSKEQPKTTTLILESYTESSSENTTSNLSGKEIATLVQEIDDSSNNKEVQPLSP